MAVVTAKHYKAVGRYGTRYGKRNREKVALIEVEQKKKHKWKSFHSGTNIAKSKLREK